MMPSLGEGSCTQAAAGGSRNGLLPAQSRCVCWGKVDLQGLMLMKTLRALWMSSMTMLMTARVSQLVRHAKDSFGLKKLRKRLWASRMASMVQKVASVSFTIEPAAKHAV